MGNVSANAAAAAKHYAVEHYEVTGNTLLPQEALSAILDRHTARLPFAPPPSGPPGSGRTLRP